MASLRLILLAASLIASPAAAELRVFSDASISSQGTSYGLNSLFDARFSPDGGVWLIGSHYKQAYPFLTKHVHWTGRLEADGSVVQFDEIGRSDYPLIFVSGSVPDFEVSPDRRHAVYRTRVGEPMEVRTLSFGASAGSSLVATEDAAVANVGGPTWATRGFGAQLAIDDSGRAVVGGFNSNAADEPLDKPDRTAIWRLSPQGSVRIAAQGEPAPGIPGVQWGALGHSPRIGLGQPLTPLNVPVATNGRGDVAFAAGLGIDGLEYAYDSGVWVDRGAGPVLVARTSQLAPGTNGARFTPNGFSPPVINSAGRVAFLADTTPYNNIWDGIWRESANGSLEHVAIYNQVDPTLTSDTEARGRFESLNELLLNDHGDVAFQGRIRIRPTDDASSEYYENAIWFAPAGAQTQRLVTGQNRFEAEGADQWDIEYSDLKLNNAGQIAYVAHVGSRGDNGFINRTLVARAIDTNGETIELLRVGDTIPLGADGISDPSVVIDLSLRDFDDAGRALVSVASGGNKVALVISDAVAAPSIVGDYNDDGLTNAADYDTWRSNYGQTVRIGDGADGNLDGVIDAADYTVWRDALTAASPSTVVPEPTALALLAAALAASLSGRPT